MSRQDKLKERLMYFLPTSVASESTTMSLKIPNRATAGFKPGAVSDTIRNLIYDKFNKNMELESHELVENDGIFNFKILVN
jgi:hypothetical protein